MQISFQTVRAFLPWMLETNYGYIVNVSSIAAFGGYPYSADYSGSKAAVLNFSETLRSELFATGRLGVNVTCVCPLFINTRMVWQSRALKKDHSESTMEPLYVAKKILTAMTNKQFLLALPRMVYLASFLKRFVILYLCFNCMVMLFRPSLPLSPSFPPSLLPSLPPSLAPSSSILPQKAYDTYLFERFFKSANPLQLSIVPAVTHSE